MTTSPKVQKSSIPEIWKPIKGFEGKYSISNKGRVKSLARFVKNRKDSVRWRKERIIKGSLKNGYRKHCLYDYPIESYCFTHRLVAQAFIPNPENKPQVNHKNGVTHDNSSENLEWCTPQENTRHAHITGLCNNAGDKHVCSVLKEEDVIQIRKQYKNKILNQRELSEKYGVSRRNINYIINRVWWKHV